MLKRFITLSTVCLLLFAFNQKVHCENLNPIRYCSQQTQQATTLIQQLPEARALLEQIARDGGVGIEIQKRHTGFNAYWYGSRRVITLSPKYSHSIGKQINSILFEMHNAASTHEISRYMNMARSGKITRDEYIEAIERIEHKNALNTCKLLKLGIERGLFPKDSWWSMPQNFNDYFRIQKQCGHSQFIAKAYDRMAPRHSPKREKYLALKRELESGDRDKIASATKQLSKELRRLDKNSANPGDVRMFHQIFSGNPVYEVMK